MRVQLLSVVSVLVGMGPIALCAGPHFDAGLEAEWQFSSSPLSCRLSQIVPGYGQVEFRREAGMPVQLFLYLESDCAGQTVLFSGTRPNWRSGNGALPSQSAKCASSMRPLALQTEYVSSMLQNLEKGWGIDVRHMGGDGQARAKATLSPIRFEAAHRQYRNCVFRLPTVSYPSLYRSEVFFESGSARLTRETKLWLSNVAIYAAQEEVISVALEGYADRVGSYEANVLLSRLRVDAVKAHLVQLGVPEQKISTAAFGGNRPIGVGHTAEDRARNRHVRIKLRR